MDRYIGLDVHAASTTVAVIAQNGKRVTKHVVETNGQALVELLKTIPGRKHVILEEGTQSCWLHEILSPHAVEVVVVAIMERRKGNKDDERDAFALAEQLRVGAVKHRVYKGDGTFKALRHLSSTYAMVVEDVVRVKNRLKSLYRSRGIPTAGTSLYAENDRAEWVAMLPEATRSATLTLFAQHDAMAKIRDQAEAELLAEARKYSITRVLQTCPGLGPIRVAQLLPVVMSPARFRTKRQFWSYCGLGIVMRSSADWVRDKNGNWSRQKVPQTIGLNRNHNHLLKNIFKGAATTVITKLKESDLHQGYARQLAAGTKPNLAKLTLARKIAAIALAVWKSGENYDPTKHRKQR
jgi:transposase